MLASARSVMMRAFARSAEPNKRMHFANLSLIELRSGTAGVPFLEMSAQFGEKHMQAAVTLSAEPGHVERPRVVAMMFVNVLNRAANLASLP